MKSRGHAASQRRPVGHQNLIGAKTEAFSLHSATAHIAMTWEFTEWTETISLSAKKAASIYFHRNGLTHLE